MTLSKLLFLIFLFSGLKSYSQNSFFEFSDSPTFDCGIDKVISDANGFVYAVSSPKSVFPGPGDCAYILKTDLNGTILFRKPFCYWDATYFEDIAWTPDSNLIVCGFTIGCDWGPSRLGLIIKYNRQGDTLWAAQINPDTSQDFLDNHLHKIIAYPDGSLLATADSTVYKTSSTGTITWQKTLNGITSVGHLKNNGCMVATNSGVYLLDSMGVIQNTLPYNTLGFSDSLSDSTYLISDGSTLIKMDSLYSPVAQFSLPSINFPPSLVAIKHDTIWTAGNSGSDIASFDMNLNLLDTFRMQLNVTDVQVKTFTVCDTTIVIGGMEQAHKNYIYLKSISTSGNATYYPEDIALTAVSFDTFYAVPINGFPGNYTLTFFPEITVQNNGADTVHSFYASALSLSNGVCGPYQYHQLINGLGIAPGQAQQFALGSFYEILGIGIGFTYHFCPWISSPNYHVDKDHSNDFLCDSFVVDEFVFANENALQQIKIFPSPVISRLSVEVSSGINFQYHIYDILNHELLSGEKTGNGIDVSDIAPGIYFITITVGDRKTTKKFIKL